MRTMQLALGTVALLAATAVAVGPASADQPVTHPSTPHCKVLQVITNTRPGYEQTVTMVQCKGKVWAQIGLWRYVPAP